MYGGRPRAGIEGCDEEPLSHAGCAVQARDVRASLHRTWLRALPQGACATGDRQRPIPLDETALRSLRSRVAGGGAPRAPPKRSPGREAMHYRSAPMVPGRRLHIAFVADTFDSTIAGGVRSARRFVDA